MKKNDKEEDLKEGRLDLSRRTFLHKSIVAGAAVASASLFETISTMNVANAAGEAFSFAWVSDTHLYPKKLNTRFVEKAARAFAEVEAQSKNLDFMIFGGDLAQKGDPVELREGAEMLNELKIKQYFIPGEHDWYLDLGETWNRRFGESPWTFDHKGVRFIGLNTVGQAPDYWSAKGMTAKERMGHMEALDGSQAGPWAGLGKKQLEWLSSTMAGVSKKAPIIILSHNPLYEYFAPWNFWVRDWREVHEIIAPYSNVTNIHGHTHQVLYHEEGTTRFIGQLATSWPWPYAPEGVPALTRPMIRVDPGDPFDGVGWSKLSSSSSGVEQEYKMWREEVFASADVDSGTGDNRNQKLSPRIVDRDWNYQK